MTIRPALPRDASPLAALAIEVWTHTYCRPGIPPIFADYALATFTRDAMAELIADPEQHLIVDVIDYAGQEAIRGYLQWSKKEDRPLANCPDAEIDTLYVRERHKGEGIGSALLHASYDQMRTQHHNSVFLTANSENKEAIAFYLHKGFTQIGTTFFEIDGNRYPNLVLQKDF